MVKPIARMAPAQTRRRAISPGCGGRKSANITISRGPILISTPAKWLGVKTCAGKPPVRSLTHVAACIVTLAKWRNPKQKVVRAAPLAPRTQTVDPAIGRSISPIVAAALRQTTWLLTENQAVKVDALKSEWSEFAAMRRLAMRFRGILRSKNAAKLGVLADGRASIRPLCNAAVCPHLAKRYRRHEKCDR